MNQNFFAVSEFIARREQLFAKMPEHSVALVPSAHEVTRSNDTEFPFCQSKNFYYLTGFNEPDALLVMIKNQATDLQAILFCRAKEPLAEIWQGRRLGPDLTKTAYGFDQCFANSERDQHLVSYLADKQQLWFCQGADETFDQQVFQWLKQLRSQPKSGITAPAVLVDCRAMIHELRLFKSAAELEVMREVNQISCQAHRRAMEKIHAGQYEYQLEAELLHEFARNGARYPAYGSIVAGGDNANILHYTDNNDVFNDGDLVLIDAGGELFGYAADITRTFPVNGQFSAAQKALYQLVLAVQDAVIAQIRPRQTFAALTNIACDVFTEGLVKLGLLTGDLAQLKQDKACKKYFIHGLGHWLGLDVHDVGDYHVNAQREQLRPFEPGMVMTIEPGLYIPLTGELVEHIDVQYRGIGIRIEDNILVTETGYENFTASAPKTVAEIEAVMAK